MRSDPPEQPTEEDLPTVRDPRRPIGAAEQGKITNAIRRGVRRHGTFEIACEAAGITLAKLEDWMAENPHLEAMLRKDLADLKAKLFERAADEDSMQSQRKLALDMLSRLDKAWAPRTRTTLATQFTDALADLKRRFAPDRTFTGTEAYDILTDAIQKHS